jgi:hypothetical protein
MISIIINACLMVPMLSFTWRSLLLLLQDFDTFPEDAFHAWMGAALTMCFVVVVNILLISL